MVEDKKPDLTPELIRQLRNKGLNDSEIAGVVGKTRAAVSWHVRKHGMEVPRRKYLEEHFPFQVPAEQAQQAPYRNLRTHAEWYRTNGKGMSEVDLKRLRAFYTKLRDGNLVVEYDPNLPPVPGEANRGGFAYRKRLKRDRGLMIRVNEYTRLTEQGWDIWRLPVIDP